MKTKKQLSAHEDGQVTAEYAVGTLGAVTLAGVVIWPGGPYEWMIRTWLISLRSWLERWNLLDVITWPW
mgnify:CR=1 FL=1